MCLLCCGNTLAAYAVDNDIVGMNGAHRPPLSACIQGSNTGVQYIQNTQQTVTGAHWYLYIIGFILIDIKGMCIVQKRGERLVVDMFSDMGLGSDGLFSSRIFNIKVPGIQCE